LFRQLISNNLKVKSISASLAGKNALAVRRAMIRGESLLEAFKSCPTFKAVASLGFGNIKRLTSTLLPNEGPIIEFTVTRP
jgi:hypothetical protein